MFFDDAASLAQPRNHDAEENKEIRVSLFVQLPALEPHRRITSQDAADVRHERTCLTASDGGLISVVVESKAEGKREEETTGYRKERAE